MSQITYGYRAAQGGTVEIDPSAAAIVRRIHQDYAAGLSPDQIAQALSAQGAPKPAPASEPPAC